MFTKIAFVLLSICLSGLAQGATIDDYTANVATSVTKLSGVNCLAETVLNFEDAADDFSYIIENSCGSDAVTNLATELADAKDLLKKTDLVLNTNDKTCNNDSYDEELDGETEPSSKCATKLKTQMANLWTSFNKTKQDITKGLTQSYSSGACVKMAMKNFKYFLNSFPSRIQTCAEIVA